MDFDEILYICSIVTNTWNFPKFSTELWPLIDVKISIILNIFRNNEWILIKFVYALIYIIHVVTNTHYFPERFDRVMTDDWF